MATRQRPSPNEHAAILKSLQQFDSLDLKDDLIAEGVAAVFGIKGTEAELLALFFQAGQFTPVEAQRWLRDRRLPVIQFTQASGSPHISS